jgi:uncharacterized protein YaiE (UPF0345 family)
MVGYQVGCRGKLEELYLLGSAAVNAKVVIYMAGGKILEEFHGTFDAVAGGHVLGAAAPANSVKGSALTPAPREADALLWGYMQVYGAADVTFQMGWGACPGVDSPSYPVGLSADAPIVYPIGRYPEGISAEIGGSGAAADGYPLYALALHSISGANIDVEFQDGARRPLAVKAGPFVLAAGADATLATLVGGVGAIPTGTKCVVLYTTGALYYNLSGQSDWSVLYAPGVAQIPVNTEFAYPPEEG